MKNGEAIWKAAKVFGKELSVGLREEFDSLRSAADKVVTEYKQGTLSDTAKEQFAKDKTAAESVLYEQVENLERELQKLKEQLRQKKEAEEAAPVEAEPDDFVPDEPENLASNEPEEQQD